MGRWIWNTRQGSYEWREATSTGFARGVAVALAALFVVVIVLGLAAVRQALVTDSSSVARVVSAGDFGSLLAWVVALGQWAIIVGTAAFRQYWPFALIGVPALLAFFVLRKG